MLVEGAPGMEFPSNMNCEWKFYFIEMDSLDRVLFLN